VQDRKQALQIRLQILNNVLCEKEKKLINNVFLKRTRERGGQFNQE